MRVSFYGRLAEQVGTRVQNLAVPAEIKNVSELRLWLSQTQPGLHNALDSSDVRALVEDSIVLELHDLRGVREIAFLPPVSGG